MSALVEEAVVEDEEAPSKDCVLWMCEEELVWLHHHHHTDLEVIVETVTSQ